MKEPLITQSPNYPITQSIDTHAHLCDVQFDADRKEVLQRAKAAGVNTIIEIADAPNEWEKAIRLKSEVQSPKSKVPSGMNAERRQNSLEKTLDLGPWTLDAFPSLYWSCGFHPHYAEEADSFNFDIMKRIALDPNCVAIGEIGLDYFKSTASKENQIALFRKGLEIAAELEKPVVIHCRNAFSDTLRILRSFFGGVSRRELATGVIHCFSGDFHFAEGALELGFFLGVDGPITYPSAQNLREVIGKVPLERILLETDSPYLPPQNFRGKRNEPAHLPLIAEKLAELFEKNVKEIAEMTTANAKNLFRIRE